MLCERCKKNQATMRLTRVVNNKKSVINLCADCARETGNQIPAAMEGIGSILSGLMGLDTLWKTNPMQTAKAVKKCPVCGMTQEQISREGKLGCSECYITFIDEMRPLLRKIHGNCLHHGSVPQEAGAQPVSLPNDNEKTGKVTETSQSELELLQRQMKDAIAREDFEQAASLRDQIKKIQAEGADQ
jgi:protein arginine kinase activator